MNLELFDEDFVRIGKISKYSYVSYEGDSKSYGSFLIDCAKDEKILALLPRIEYILFEGVHMGVFNYSNIDSIEVAQELTLKGYMLKSVLAYRTLFPQFNATLTPRAMLNELVSIGFITNPNPDENEERMKVEAIGDEEGEKITLQVTGSDIFTQCQTIADNNDLIFDVVPTLQKYDEKSDNPTNVSQLLFKSRKRRDLTVGNVEGNLPVVFAYSLNNIESSNYSESKEGYKNTAIVAGEDSATARVMEFVSDEPIELAADNATLALMHLETLTDEVERTFTMTKGATALFTNANMRFGHKNGYFSSEATTGWFQFTNPVYPAGEVTWEWWEYRVQPYSSTSGAPYVICTDNSTNVYGARLMRDIPNQTYLVSQIGTGNSSTNIVPANTPSGTKIYNKWVHRAVVLDWWQHADGKYYSEVLFFENGTRWGRHEGTTARATIPAIYKSTNGLIGKYNGGKSAIMYIEEVRISSVARYTGLRYKVPELPFNVAAKVEYKRLTGLKRKELFVDARDLQSEDDNGKTLTASEYKKLLIARGLSKLGDYIVVRKIGATVSTSNGKVYQYGTDYEEGDLVTLVIEPLSFRVNIPIAKVTKVVQGSQTYFDLTFGDVQNFIQQQLRKENLL